MTRPAISTPRPSPAPCQTVPRSQPVSCLPVCTYSVPGGSCFFFCNFPSFLHTRLQPTHARLTTCRVLWSSRKTSSAAFLEATSPNQSTDNRYRPGPPSPSAPFDRPFDSGARPPKKKKGCDHPATTSPLPKRYLPSLAAARQTRTAATTGQTTKKKKNRQIGVATTGFSS